MATPKKTTSDRRRICFVTGTRAEFGLMRSTLLAIDAHPSLELQIVATGMHLSAAHGMTVRSIRTEGWTVNATVPWERANIASATGHAMAGISAALDRLDSDVVLAVGDRVEALAAAAAGHLSGRIVAHVHGGDRALGQVDDSLRHAITKLSHLHFPATEKSRERILKLGEDTWRVHCVGSPGIDGIVRQAMPKRQVAKVITGGFALLVLHPTDADESAESNRAALVVDCIRRAGFEKIVIVYPNNDPGSGGIIRCWQTSAGDALVFKDLPRAMFLGLLRDAAVLIGNSSAGIIEAASFGTPVIDIGPRQLGREHGANVTHVPFEAIPIERALKKIRGHRLPLRYPPKNIYGGNGTGKRIAVVLAKVPINALLQRKLIAY
jgi:UDP-hydrolysing UDP-N-acetyl-D-glucosamine 2-epimerase